MERKIARCHDVYLEEEEDEEDEDEVKDKREDPKPRITTMEVCGALDPKLDLGAVFLPDSKDRIKQEHSSRMEIDGQEDDDDDGDETDDNTNNHGQIAVVNQHLKLLAQDPHAFVRQTAGRGQGEWTVDFELLAKDLIQFELEALLTARFGGNATRVVRILQKKGKLDEKQVGQFGLIRTKELRALLTAMQEAGYVDTQEVPRDTTRQPSRTIYLWLFDSNRCRQLVLNDIYKAMARLLQRIRVERNKMRGVLEKAERTDVVGHETEYLSKPELEALEAWRATEEKLLVQLDRQDDLVALFRDFVPALS